jgi:hypothetical protein
MNFNIVLDVVVAGLLLATIAYAILLSRRLGALRNDKRQLEALVRSLDISSQRAEAGIASLKDAAEQIGQQLQQRLEQGRALQTDLSYIIDLGGGLADRLEDSIRARRDESKSASASVAELDPRQQRRLAVERPAEKPRGNPVQDEVVAAAEAARIADFPSRAERLLRGALEARR